jgi:hypothetical protein
MELRELWERYPLAYHLAEAGSWPSIQSLGLLSTSALLDLFQVSAATRLPIETCRRLSPVTITHPVYGSVVIRDQKPLNEKRLASCLTNGATVEGWLRFLNGLVFFWLREKRLHVLRGARAYREQRQCVLTVDVRNLVESHADRIRLTHMNTGTTRPFAFPRGPETFSSIATFQRQHVVELTVMREVRDIRNFVLKVEELGGGKAPVTVWEKQVLHSR